MRRAALATLACFAVFVIAGKSAGQEERHVWVYIADVKGNPLKGIQVSTVEGHVMAVTGASGKAPVLVPPTTAIGSPITFVITSRQYDTFTGGPIRARIAAIDSPDKPIEINLRRRVIASSVLPQNVRRRGATTNAGPSNDSYLKGMRALQDQRFEDALSALSGPLDERRGAYERRPSKVSQSAYAEAGYAVGQALYGLRRFAEAAEKFQIATKLNTGPTGNAAKVFLASCLSISGDYGRARDLLDEALAKPRQLPVALVPLAHIWLADIYRLYGRLDEERKQLEAMSEFDNVGRIRSGTNPVAELSTRISTLSGTSLKNGNALPNNLWPAYHLALIILNKVSVAQAETEFGILHPTVAEFVERLAGVYENGQQYEQAELQVRRALHIRESVYGSAHLLVAASLLDLGNLEIKRERTDKAREYLERARGIIDASTANATLIKSSVYMELGRLESGQRAFAQGEADYLIALGTLRDMFGDTHFLVLSVLYALAELYTDKEDYAQATSYMDRALDLSKRLWGTTDSEGTALIVETLGDLSELYRKQGKESDAERVEQERKTLEGSGVAIAKNETVSVFSSEDKSNLVGINLNGHKCTFNNSPQYIDHPESSSLLLSALKAADAQLRAPDPDVVNVLYALALISHSRGKESEALDFVERALSMTGKLLQPNPLGMARLMNLRGVALFALGELPRAERWFREALANFELVQGNNTKDLAPVLLSLGRTLGQQHKYPDAEEPLQRALLILEAQDSICADPDSVTILGELARLDCEQRNYEAAELRFRQILELLTDKALFQHPHAVEILEAYAQCLRAMNRSDEAASIQDRANLVRAHHRSTKL